MCNHGNRRITQSDTSNPHSYKRGAIKNYLADFFRYNGRGHPPILLSFFGQNHILLRGGGVTPNSAKEKSAKNSYFWPKSPYLPFFKRFSVQGGGAVR